MFIVILSFSDNKDQAGKLMPDHNAWIECGFADGIFLMAGSLRPGPGGTVIAHNTSRNELEARISEDPFVAKNVVKAEIIEVAPSRTDERFAFLLN